MSEIVLILIGVMVGCMPGMRLWLSYEKEARGYFDTTMRQLFEICFLEDDKAILKSKIREREEVIERLISSGDKLTVSPNYRNVGSTETEWQHVVSDWMEIKNKADMEGWE